MSHEVLSFYLFEYFMKSGRLNCRLVDWLVDYMVGWLDGNFHPPLDGNCRFASEGE